MIRYLQPAKLVSTTATHVVTTIILLNGHVTTWTLFRMTFMISTIGGIIFGLQLLVELCAGETFMPRNIMRETGFCAASPTSNYGVSIYN